MRNTNETYIVICEDHLRQLIERAWLSPWELLACRECETPATVGIRAYPRNQHNPATDTQDPEVLH